MMEYQTLFNSVKHNSLTLRYIPNHYKTKEMCEHAFRFEPKTIEFIPDEMITSSMVERYIRIIGEFPERTPEHLKTKDLLIECEDKKKGI